MSAKRPRVLLLLSEADTVGGVQLVSKQLAVALDRLADTTTLSLHDAPDTVVTSGSETAAIRGFAGNKAGFAIAAGRGARGADLVFVAHPNFASLIPLIAPRRSAVLAYGLDGWNRASWARRAGMRRADMLGAISQYTLDRTMQAQDVHPREAFVLALGLEPERGPDRPHAPAAAPTLLSVTRLASEDPYKGIDDTIRALPALLERIPGLHYRVVGDGDDRPRLEGLARELGVAGAVAFEGRVSDQALRDAYATAHAFVLPSSEEGFGLVFIEAMAWGLPVVAARAGATPEVVIENETGLLVDKGDEARLVDALGSVLTDADLASRLGAAGSERVQERFLLRHFEDRVEKLLPRLLRGRSAPK